MTTAVRVAILTSVDPVLRETVASGLLWDLPGTAAVVLDVIQEPQPVLRGTVLDGIEVLDRFERPLADECVGCAIRAQALDVVDRLVRVGSWSQLIVVAPVGYEPAPLADALPRTGGREPGSVVDVTSVVAAVELDRLHHDLFADDLLAERGLGFDAADRRSVGEVLARQVELADLVVVSSPSAATRPAAIARTVLRHLVRPGVATTAVNDLDPAALFNPAIGPADRRRDTDGAEVRRSGARDEDGVWTLELSSWRPFHPGRLYAHLAALTAGPQRGRGHFWLPGRPSTMCRWDAVGGQLSIGVTGTWDASPASTHLVVTGLGRRRERIVRAFQRCLLTDVELSSGTDRWLGVDDGFSPWLGHAETWPATEESREH